MKKNETSTPLASAPLTIPCHVCQREADFIVRVKNQRGIKVDVYECEKEHRTEVPVVTTS